VQPKRPSAPLRPGLLGALLLCCGCATSTQDPSSTDLRRSIVRAVQQETGGLTHESTPPATLHHFPPTDFGFSQERRAELEALAGWSSYASSPTPPDTDLLGQTSATVSVSLERVIRAAVGHNLRVQSARLDPAIRAAQLVQAEAQFDWVFFTGVDWSNIDEPRVVPVIGGVPVGSRANVSQAVAYDTGVRRPLTTGGELSVSQGLTHSETRTPGLATAPEPANNAFVEVGLNQPLLRGFGSDATESEIHLARNAERSSIQTLKAQAMRTALDAETAYWDLVRARRRLLIANRLLERGVQTRDVLKGRLDFDVRPAEYSDSVARVEGRRADVIRAQRAVREASDRLKVILNDPNLPVGSETLLVPADEPVDEPISFSLVDALVSALENRPELERALLAIDDASIRQAFADNARLPLLDLAVRTRFNGLDDSPGGAYDQITDGDFVNYIASLQFEQPIGNRAAEALSRARRLERMKSVLDYKAAAQDAALRVKSALRNVVTNYQLIEQTRVARLAASENLRTLLVEEETLRALTPDFLDLKLRRQESLAAAELEEMAALVDYNISIAEMFDAMGRALERNGIRFDVHDSPATP